MFSSELYKHAQQKYGNAQLFHYNVILGNETNYLEG